MEKKTESIKKTKRDKWQLMFEMDQYIHPRSYKCKFYVNSEMNKIKRSHGKHHTTITCPIELDRIISFYLCGDKVHFSITTKLLEVINNIFNNCGKECKYWKEWTQKLGRLKKLYKRKGFRPLDSISPTVIKRHEFISKLYTT